MPKARKKPTAVDSDTLRQLLGQGVKSHVLQARLDYMDVEGVARYVRIMRGQKRVNPRMLPTQLDGRWSTSDPPLVNFPAWLRGGTKLGPDGKPHTPPPVIIPDPGTWWLSWDWNALHARIAVAYSGDPVDTEAFNNEWDVHTLTACGMWGIPLPPVRTKTLHNDPSCEAWRQYWSPPWQGDDDRRRRLAKMMRYATLLGKDERSALESKDVEKEGLTRQEILQFAKQYLAAKPHLVACKQKHFALCAESGESRTFMGRRRRLFGDWWDRAKEGWAHKLQGGEADMMATCLIAAHQMFTDTWLILNSHDGAILGFPESYDPGRTKESLSRVVEQAWMIEGVPIKTSADWKVWSPDGRVLKLK